VTDRYHVATVRLQDALAAMKKQAEAAEWLFPDNPPATIARGHTALREAQAVMAEHTRECQLIVRAVYALDSTIPEVTHRQILAWLGNRENS